LELLELMPVPMLGLLVQLPGLLLGQRLRE
jgi:hypothetical protein